MTKQVNQSTLNVILVAALSVTTTIVGVGVMHVVSLVENKFEQDEEKDAAMLKALQALDKRVTVLETKEDMRD